MKFTQDYSSFLIPYWKKYFSQYIGKPDINYLEVGVFEGRTSFWVTENILTENSCTATLIDIFNNSYKKNFFENLYNFQYKNKIKTYENSSSEVLPNLKKNSYDIIYLDGEHNSQAVSLDASYSWRLLKNGGYLIFDDYKLYEGEYPDHCRAQAAIDFFLFSFQNEIKLIHKCNEWVIVQKNENIFSAEYDTTNSFAFDFFNKQLFHITGDPININPDLVEQIFNIFKNKESYQDPDNEINSLLNK